MYIGTVGRQARKIGIRSQSTRYLRNELCGVIGVLIVLQGGWLETSILYEKLFSYQSKKGYFNFENMYYMKLLNYKLFLHV